MSIPASHFVFGTLTIALFFGGPLVRLSIAQGVPPPQADEKTPTTSVTGPEAEAILTIRGRVFDNLGKVISKAEVCLPLRGPGAYHAKTITCQTNGRGEFEFALPEGWRSPMRRLTNPIIWVYAPGYAVSTMSASQQMFSNSKEALEIRLQAAAKTSFVIVDHLGNPAAGAAVSPRSVRTQRAYDLIPDEMTPFLTGTTDSNGRVQLPGAPAKGLFRVSVVAKGFGVQEQTLNAEIDNPDERTIRLQPAGRVEGHVTSENPEWMRGLTIYLESGDRESAQTTKGFAITKTDVNGQFQVPNMATGELSLGTLLDRNLPFRASLPIGYQIVPGSTTTVKIALVKGIVVHGRLEAEGKPVVGACISVGYGNHRQSDTVFTNAEGQFEARVLPGAVSQHVIFLPQPGFRQQGGDGKIIVPSDVETFELPPVELVPRNEPK